MDTQDLPRRLCAHKHSAGPDLALPEHPTAADRSPVHASQAPRAARGRAIRRRWASETNRVLRHTGDRAVALRAGAVEVAAALDTDDLASRIAQAVPAGRYDCLSLLTLPQAAHDRMKNKDGALDRTVDAIIADLVPGDAGWPDQAD